MQSSIYLCLSQSRINLEGAAGKASGVKKMTERGGLLISSDGVTPTRIVGVPASCCPPYYHEVQKKLSSGTGAPRWSQKRAIKRLWCGGGTSL